MPNEAAITQKIKELADALKERGLWQDDEPEWVNVYEKNLPAGEKDFFSWLQFIYLPNLLLDENNKQFIGKKNYVAPQAVHFFRNKFTEEKLLRLLVELDSLTN